MDCLSNMFLVIPMSGDNPWTLTAKHVKVAFRLVVSIYLQILNLFLFAVFIFPLWGGGVNTKIDIIL